MKTEDLIAKFIETHLAEIKGSNRDKTFPMPKPVTPLAKKGNK